MAHTLSSGLTVERMADGAVALGHEEDGGEVYEIPHDEWIEAVAAVSKHGLNPLSRDAAGRLHDLTVTR